MFEQHCGNNTFFYLGTRLLERLLLQKRRNSGFDTTLDQITHSPSFSPIRENGGWESLHVSASNLAHDFEKSHFEGMVGRLRIGLSPATRVRSVNGWYWRVRTAMENT